MTQCQEESGETLHAAFNKGMHRLLSNLCIYLINMLIMLLYWKIISIIDFGTSLDHLKETYENSKHIHLIFKIKTEDIRIK